MSDEILVTGVVSRVDFCGGQADVYFRPLGQCRVVSCEQGDIARAAMREGREIQIVDTDDCGRVVRLMPSVVVRERGPVDIIRRIGFGEGKAAVDVSGRKQTYRVEVGSIGRRIAAQAMADNVEVEIVSIDDGPDTLRRAPEPE
jgi:hypothetical protein